MIIFYNAHTEYAAHILLCSCDILMSGFIFWPYGNPAEIKNLLGKSIRMGHSVLHKQNGTHLYDYQHLFVSVRYTPTIRLFGL